MRPELVVFAVIVAAVLVLGLFGRALVINTAITEVKGAFPGYDVSIGSTELRSAAQLALTDIDIRKDSTLRCRIKEVAINFSLPSLFTKAVPKVTVKNPYLQLTAPEKCLKEIFECPTQKSGKSFMARSAVVSDLRVAVDTADWKLDMLASGRMETNKTPAGEMETRGDFSTGADGGRLDVKDENFLRRVAVETERPLEAVKEDFKNYHFTKGTLQISRNVGGVSCRIVLDGPEGKRGLAFSSRGF